MAKLFCTVQSERTQKHQIANKELKIKIYYGSREDSKLLAALYLFPTEDVPKFMKTTVDPTPVTFKPSKKAAEDTSNKEDNSTFYRLFPRISPFFDPFARAQSARVKPEESQFSKAEKPNSTVQSSMSSPSKARLPSTTCAN